MPPIEQFPIPTKLATKADVGLANVDNTADLAKPISIAVQAALDLKRNAGAIQLSDIAQGGAVTGQVIKWNGSAWVPGTDNVGEGGGGGGLTSFAGRTGPDITPEAGDYSFAQIASKPTTLSGYGITDATPNSHVGTGGTSHANATTSVAGFMSTGDKIKLDGVANGATANSPDATLLDRGNHTGAQAIGTVTGLQAALDAKAPINNPTFTGTVGGITRAMVGLGNVDNTSDASKPVSSAQAAAIATKNDNLQFQDEGTNLGASGTVNTFNVTGGGASAARVGNVVTINVPAPTAGGTAVTDAGGYFVGDDVEEVLQEVGAELATKADANGPATISAATNLTRALHGNRLVLLGGAVDYAVTIEDDATGGWGGSDYSQFLNVGTANVTIQGDGTSAVTPAFGSSLVIPPGGFGGMQRSGANAWSAYGRAISQDQATWNAGVGTVESPISPAKLAAAVAALAPGGSGDLYPNARTWGVLAQINQASHGAVGSGTVTIMGTGGAVSAPWNTDRGWVRVAYTNTGAAANLTAGIRGAAGSVDMAPGADARATPATFKGAIGTADALTGCRGFLGWRTATNDPGATEPSTFTNFAAIFYDSDMNEYVFGHNDGSGVATEVVLNGGSGFPSNTNGADKIVLELAFTGEGGAQTMHWRVTNDDTGVSVEGTATTNLPASGSLMNFYAYRNSGANTTAPTVHVGDLSGGKLALVTVAA